VPARWTLAQALVALAWELDPELCRALAAVGEDIHRIFVEPPSMFDWSPLALDVLRLEECKQRLVAELLSRVLAGTLKLIRLPNKPGQDEDQLTDLVPENLDIPKSEVILGGQHYRVRVEKISASNAAVAAPPKKPGRPPRLDVRERMHADLKQQPNGEWKLIDESGRRIAQKHWQERYGAARTTCAKALAELMSEIRKSTDCN
jgi:hypothetical protein